MDTAPMPRAGRRRVLHLSDLHLTANGMDEDGVDARSSLRRMLDDARHVPHIDVVVVSGDTHALPGTPRAGACEGEGRNKVQLACGADAFCGIGDFVPIQDPTCGRTLSP